MERALLPAAFVLALAFALPLFLPLPAKTRQPPIPQAQEWGWKPEFNLRKTAEDMLTNLRLFPVLQIKTPETASLGEKSHKVIV